MKNEQSISSLFLKAFVKELILNTDPGYISKNPEPLPEKPVDHESRSYRDDEMQPSMFSGKGTDNQIIGKAKQELNPGASNIEDDQLKPSMFRIGENPENYKPETPALAPKSKINPLKKSPLEKQLLKKLQAKPLSMLNTPAPFSPGNIGNPDMGHKINHLLEDPRVRIVECPGPNKNLLVRKDGLVQRTKEILDENEIDEVINIFSEKTKIPLIGGTFKAALGNIIMTAVRSEFVGSRFIIQKKSANSGTEY